MSKPTVEHALEGIYTALNADNENLDESITNLKSALDAEGESEIIVDPARLVHNNRQGRKLMQSYFRKRGITVTFST